LTTASAPSGIIAPVKIFAAYPDCIFIFETPPAGISSTIFRVTGFFNVSSD